MVLRLTAAFIVAWSLTVLCPQSLAQELKPFRDAEITTDEWQQRVRDARHRSEQFVANARTQSLERPTTNKEEEEAEASNQRAMNDPSLQLGDIIATSRGFLVFVGRDSEERRSADFLPIPHPRPLPPR
jgi:hypothetical protein